jgi:hypothetical protein
VRAALTTTDLPPAPFGPTLNAVVRDHLERLGYLEDFDEMVRGGRGT